MTTQEPHDDKVKTIENQPSRLSIMACMGCGAWAESKEGSNISECGFCGNNIVPENRVVAEHAAFICPIADCQLLRDSSALSRLGNRNPNLDQFDEDEGFSLIDMMMNTNRAEWQANSADRDTARGALKKRYANWQTSRNQFIKAICDLDNKYWFALKGKGDFTGDQNLDYAGVVLAHDNGEYSIIAIDYMPYHRKETGDHSDLIVRAYNLKKLPQPGQMTEDLLAKILNWGKYQNPPDDDCRILNEISFSFASNPNKIRYADLSDSEIDVMVVDHNRNELEWSEALESKFLAITKDDSGGHEPFRGATGTDFSKSSNFITKYFADQQVRVLAEGATVKIGCDKCGSGIELGREFSAICQCLSCGTYTNLVERGLLSPERMAIDTPGEMLINANYLCRVLQEVIGAGEKLNYNGEEILLTPQSVVELFSRDLSNVNDRVLLVNAIKLLAEKKPYLFQCVSYNNGDGLGTRESVVMGIYFPDSNAIAESNDQVVVNNFINPVLRDKVLVLSSGDFVRTQKDGDWCSLKTALIDKKIFDEWETMMEWVQVAEKIRYHESPYTVEYTIEQGGLGKNSADDTSIKDWDLFDAVRKLPNKVPPQNEYNYRQNNQMPATIKELNQIVSIDTDNSQGNFSRVVDLAKRLFKRF